VWASEPVWTGAENLDHIEIRSPDRPARSCSARTSWKTLPYTDSQKLLQNNSCIMFCEVSSVMVTRITQLLKISTPSFGLQTEIRRHVCKWSVCEDTCRLHSTLCAAASCILTFVHTTLKSGSRLNWKHATSEQKMLTFTV
jgi:hypothetical protein